MPLEKMRSLDDFLVGGARYEMPNFRDLERWNNRILQNLIYYQTNYFAGGALVALALSALAPLKTGALAGCCSLVLCAFYALYLTPAAAGSAASSDPLASLLAPLGAAVPAHLRSYAFTVCVTAGLLGIAAAGAILHTMLLVLVPAFAALVHASLRMRNVSNKLVNLLTDARHTPMGWALRRLERLAGSSPPAEGADDKRK